MAGIFREQVVKRFFDKRSPKWPKFRVDQFRSGKNFCINCGKKPKFLRRFRLQFHHIVPFHVDPSKELDPENVVALCSNPRCHLDKGHLGYWRSWNENVIEDCKIWRNKYLNRPLFNKSQSPSIKEKA